jgi:hypothetical protein
MRVIINVVDPRYFRTNPDPHLGSGSIGQIPDPAIFVCVLFIKCTFT